MTGSGARFDFATGRRPRRPSLTPLVDVVFLLLVFFMLAARVGPERGLPLEAGAGAGPRQGPPRLVLVTAGGVHLNGAPVDLEGLAAALAPLMPAPDAPVVIRPAAGVEVQALVDVMLALRAAGYPNLILVE